MARKKVKLAYIINASKRNAVFRKMKNDLIKELDEMKSLFGMEGFAIISYPNYPHPVVWPSVSEVQRVISRLRVLEMEQSKKMLDQELFLIKQKNMKLDEQMKKKRDENQKMAIAYLMLQDMENDQSFRNMSINDRKTLLSWYGEKCREIKHELEQMLAQKVIQDFGEQEKMIHAQGPESNMDDK